MNETMSKETFIANVITQVGKPYQWGAWGPDAFDCSGLVSYCLGLPEKLDCLHLMGKYTGNRVRYEDAGPGCLLFYGKDGVPDHVMIVVRKWQSGIPIIVGARGGDDSVVTEKTAAIRKAFVDVCFGDYWFSRYLFALNPFKEIDK